MPQKLEASHLVSTSATLQRRIEERFEGASLARVASDVHELAKQAASVAEWLARPIWPLRLLVGASLLLLAAVLIATFSQVQLAGGLDTAQQLVPFLESLINDIVFMGVGIYFLVGVEVRIKRRRAQQALYVLRSLAHIVDMHQLTKDPERLLLTGPDTASSPVRAMTAFELTRYLDYASEILAIISKIAAVYVQHFEDAVTISAASDLEDLTGGLSRKIWQKIMLLDGMQASVSRPAAEG